MWQQFFFNIISKYIEANTIKQIWNILDFGYFGVFGNFSVILDKVCKKIIYFS